MALVTFDMPIDRRAEIDSRLTRYRLIEKRLAPVDASNFELTTLRRVIADLELQLKELDK